MGLLSFVVVANCQARPIAAALEAMTTGTCRNLGVIITHLRKDSDALADLALLEDADIIFAQRVDPSYPVSHVVTENIKRGFEGRVISWPNIYFTGQSPRLCYVSGVGEKRILGPLSEYQYLPIFMAWQSGSSVTKCLRDIETGVSISTSELVRNATRSLDQLRGREEGLDVIASDLIERDWRLMRLFFTFNHPSSKLLLPIAKRLLLKAGLCSGVDISPEEFGEPLSRIIPPILDTDSKELGLSFETSLTSEGVDLHIVGGTVILGKRKVYALHELVEVSYRAFDAQKNFMTHTRITPV